MARALKCYVQKGIIFKGSHDGVRESKRISSLVRIVTGRQAGRQAKGRMMLFESRNGFRLWSE